MSITDELRTWMYGHTVNCSDNRIALVAIADRIDAEHRKAAAGCIHYDPERHYCAVHGDTEHEWVRLPVDADGVPIRVRDKMCQIRQDGTLADPFEVAGFELVAGELWPIEKSVGYKNNVSPRYLRHYHEPTVEDVLDEFVARWMDTHHDDLPALKAEYAAKLRLAGEDE